MTPLYRMLSLLLWMYFGSFIYGATKQLRIVSQQNKYIIIYCTNNYVLYYV